ELLVEPPAGIGDHGEGKVAVVGAQSLGPRMEDDDLDHPRRADLVVAGADLPQVQAAAGAAGEAAELQVDQPSRLAEADRFAPDRRQQRFRHRLPPCPSGYTSKTRQRAKT